MNVRQHSRHGHARAVNRKNQGVFVCAWGYEADAEVSTSKNILAAGLAVAGRGGTPHAKPKKAERSDPVKRQPLERTVAWAVSLTQESPSVREGRMSMVRTGQRGKSRMPFRGPLFR